MTDQAKAVEVKKTDQELAKEFIENYKALCEKFQFRLVITPVWIATNHGSFELTLQQSVEKVLNRKEENLTS